MTGSGASFTQPQSRPVSPNRDPGHGAPLRVLSFGLRDPSVLGFANRDPAKAAISAGGCAYLIIGAEPGHPGGQAPIDLADLTAGIDQYVGRDGPAWAPL